jgi:hypothetical protein
MGLSKKNISAIGMGKVISESIMGFLQNTFHRVMDHLEVSYDQRTQAHDFEFFCGYLFIISFGLSERYDPPTLKIISNVVRDNIIKSYFNESEYYSTYVSAVDFRMNEYSKIVEEENDYTIFRTKFAFQLVKNILNIRDDKEFSKLGSDIILKGPIAVLIGVDSVQSLVSAIIDKFKVTSDF